MTPGRGVSGYKRCRVPRLSIEGPIFKREHCMDFFRPVSKCCRKRGRKDRKMYISDSEYFSVFLFFVCAIIASVANTRIANSFKIFRRLERFIAGSAKLLFIFEGSAPLTNGDDLA